MELVNIVQVLGRDRAKGVFAAEKKGVLFPQNSERV
jgi:hypothetical protein